MTPNPKAGMPATVVDVVANLRSDAAQSLRMAQATEFGKDLSVRVAKPDLLIGNMVEAADLITALLAEAEQARKRLEGELDLVSGQMRLIAKSNSGNFDRAEAAEAENKRLRDIIGKLLRSEYESAEPGLCDCIDNDGKPYQSQFLATAIADAEALLQPKEDSSVS